MSTHTRARAFLLCPEMFEDPRLASLRSSRPNRQLMFDVLADERSGVCDRSDITAMSNEPNSIVQPRLEHWFASATADDVLVFYYSGHGLAEDGEELRLATATAGEHGSHAVSGHELASWIGRCRARLVYVIVDAAHPGPQDVRTDGRVHQIIGSGDGVVADSPAGQPSPFTRRIASWFESSADPSLDGLFRWLRGTEQRAVAPQPVVPRPVAPAPAERAPAVPWPIESGHAVPVIEPFVGPIVEQTTATPAAATATTPATAIAPATATTPATTARPATAGATIEMAETPPLGSPVPVAIASSAPLTLQSLQSDRRRRRRWGVSAGVALVLVLGVAGALTRCGGSDEEADSTTPTSVATTLAASSSTEASTVVPAATVPPSVVVTPAPTAEVPPAAPTTDVASEPPATTTATAPTTVPAPATIELGIAGHPLATPACTGGWITQLASVDSTSEYAKATVTEQLAVAGASYTYAPDSCSTFDKGGKWYVVYLGPFATKDAADAACAASGDEDCFARQLQ